MSFKLSMKQQISLTLPYLLEQQGALKLSSLMTALQNSAENICLIIYMYMVLLALVEETLSLKKMMVSEMLTIIDELNNVYIM